jgi:hypothetical protein
MTSIAPSVPSSEKSATQVYRDTTGKRSPTHELHEAVAVAAYFLAERRAFEPGYEVQDWLAAERQVGGNGINLA